MAKKTKKASTLTRAPIVAILGHVDHGKTTLLDALRQTNLVAKEHGGITQHIGAYQVEYQGKPITFIDTPGHAAFSKMRARGANVTDIVVLVVAANDGVKPQTVESIKHIKAAGAPIIVAINKIDVTGASPDMVKAQLTEHEVFVEGYGGQTPAVEISALKKEGLDQLLEMIILLAEVEELESHPSKPLDAIIIESEKDKRRGPVATAIVKQGTISMGDSVFVGTQEFKVKAMFDHMGKLVRKAIPGQPVEVMGFKQVPQVGSSITPSLVEPEEKKEDSTKDEKDKQKSKKKAIRKGTEGKGKKAKEAEEVEDEEPEEEEKPTINLVLKADTAGTLEAIIASIGQEEISLVGQGIGPVNESDILLAQATEAVVITFNVSTTTSAKRLAQIENITIERFNIIYELLEYLEKKVLKLLEPTIDEEETGTAKISMRFDIRGEAIAGCEVTSGKVNSGNLVHLERDKNNLADSRIKSLKSGKDDVKTVKAGNECGIILDPQIDFKVGDVIRSYRKINQ